MRTFIVGTRQSDLALTQTNQVIEQLRKIASEQGIKCDFQVKKMVTKGDRILDVTLSKVGGKGLFVKEIEQALIDKEIDIAVHSMKDVPSELPDGLVIGAVPKRVDPRDCLISQHYAGLDDLPQGARVGTSSLRRASQLKAYRSDLHIESIRGNIDTRISKLENGEFDAILLAAAGLHRMGWQDRISEYLSPDICLPAVGQGALGIECREDDDEVNTLLSYFNDSETAITVQAERSYLAKLNGGCQIPIGAYAELQHSSQEQDSPVISLTGMVGSPDGKEILKETLTGNDPKLLGILTGEKLIERGAERILSEIRG
jgi:hydroxymethylbilane synthase